MFRNINRKRIFLTVTVIILILVIIVLISMYNENMNITNSNNTDNDIPNNGDLIINNENNIDDGGAEYSESTEELAGNNATSINQGNVDSNLTMNNGTVDSNGNSIVANEQSQESKNRDAKLATLDQDANKSLCENIIKNFRCYNVETFSSGEWLKRLSGDIDETMMKNNDDTSNLLYTETLSSYVKGMSSYKGIYSNILSINDVYEYIDTDYTPVVAIKVDENSNRDYPYPGSDHWKPVDHYKKMYLLYLNSDGSKCFKITEVKAYRETVDTDVFNSGIIDDSHDENERSR